MHVVVRIALAGALVAAPARPAVAQGEHGHAGASPDSVGRVGFAVSCKPAAQRRFEHAVALLHSFWYEQAERAFAGVVAADPGCGMGYWGRAMSLLHPLWTPPSPADGERGLAAAERAVTLTRPRSRERAYAEAIATFYRGYRPGGFRDRLLAYETAMEGLRTRYPADEEARIFCALALIAHGQLDSGDTTYARQRRAGALLEPLFRKHPRHPGIAHYLIHAYDNPPLAGRAVAAAAAYARIAPAVPHAQHMPSHIYTRIGRWEPSIASNLRSAAAARAFERSRRLPLMWDERAHAEDYLTYAYLQLGRDREARRLVDRAAAASASYPDTSFKADYAFAAIPARYGLERGRWAEAKALAVRPAPAWPATEAITRFARAIGAARSGDAVGARAEVDTLRRIESALAAAGGLQAYWSTQVKIQRMAAGAWAALAAGDTARALEEARAAADLEDATEKHPVSPGPVLPARELYGDVLLEAGRPAEARRVYEAALARQPNRARALFGAARAAERAGDRLEARRYYGELARLLAHGDGDRPELEAARRVLAGR